MADLKQCSKCRNIKPVSEFSKLSSSSDGLQYKCKACAKAYRDARIDEVRRIGREYYADNRDTLREKARVAYRENPQKFLDRNRGWAERNPVKIKLGKREYYREHSGRINAVAAKWAKDNPELRKAVVAKHAESAKIMRRFYTRSMHARKFGCQISTPSQEAVEAKVEYHNGKCYICGAEWECFDHIKPISKGGPHMLSNMKPCCNKCNQEKHAKWPYDWREKSRITQ